MSVGKLSFKCPSTRLRIQESHAGKNLQAGYSNAEGKSRATKTNWVEDHSWILHLAHPRGEGER